MSHRPVSERRVNPVTSVLRTVIAAVVAVLAIAALAPSVASAQSDDAEVKGRLQARDAEGERVGVGGVEFIASDLSGNEIARGVSDEEGNWSIQLPPGTYDVLLNVDTLPDGRELRNPDKNPAQVRLIEGDSKSALFPLGEAQASTSSEIEFVQLTVDGLKLGLIIAMCAIGLSLIYGTTGLTNFAHGEAVTFGAVMAYLLNVTGIFGLRIHLLIAAPLVIVISGCAGWLFNRFVWFPMRRRGASLISALVMSIGFSIFFRYVILYQFGGRAKRLTDYQLQTAWDLGWFRLLPKDLVIMVLSIVVLLSVGIALQTTRVGKAMRAVADNRDLAESSGIDVERVIRWVWVTGTALAGFGGVLFATTESINWEMGFRILLLMFAGVTLGGLGTAYGALFGSIIVGLFIQLSTLVIPTDMKNVGALLMLVVILLVRPQGLLGRKERVG